MATASNRGGAFFFGPTVTHQGLDGARLVVSQDAQGNVMTLKGEARSNDPAPARRVAGSLSAVTRLEGTVELASPGHLAAGR